MAGLRVTLPMPGTGEVVNPDDQLLTAGSLLLVDPMHSTSQWAAGVPATGTTRANLAWAQAAAVLGSGDATTLAPTFDISTAFTATDATQRGAAERTTKGGLHVATSVASSLAAGDGANLRLPSALRTYLQSNPTHRYFVTLWGQFTRADTKTSTPHPEIMSLGMSTNPSNQIALYRASQAFTATAYTGNSTTKDNDITGPFRLNCDPTGTGTPAADGRLSWGAGQSAYSTYNKSSVASFNSYWPSWVLYRWYIEDLTVSGRAYSTVAALDVAAFNAATTGTGRYAADTWTAPATLAA